MSVQILGSINMDIVLTVDEIPMPGVTTLAQDRELFPGGKGANQAISSARCGVATTMIGAVGEDAFGDTLLTFLNDNHIQTEHIQRLKARQTGQAYINLDRNGENSIVVLPGANYHLKIPEHALQIKSKNLIRLTQFEVPMEQIKYFFSAKGSLNIINAAPANLEGLELFNLADIIIVNQSELEFLTKQTIAFSNKNEEINTAAKKLISKENQWVIVTLGSQGCIAISNTEVIRVEGIKVKTIDTTGAGDCFCGALAASLSDGATMKSALKFANIAGSLAVTKKGAGPSMPYKKEIMKAIE